jgi:hypothetical protein
MPTDILEDLVEVSPFAAKVKKHPRTIIRWMDEPNGLPFVKLGNRRLIHIPTARQWLLGRTRTRNPNPRT